MTDAFPKMSNYSFKISLENWAQVRPGSVPHKVLNYFVIWCNLASWTEGNSPVHSVRCMTCKT